MTKINDSKTNEVDICLIMEGTYPYLSGGVANWVQELIKAFPQYKFAAIFLGTSPEDYAEPFYKLPENLVRLDTFYLFKSAEDKVKTYKPIDGKTLDTIRNLHIKLADFLTKDGIELTELYELMEENAKPDKNSFLKSKQAWQFIVETYSTKHNQEAFFEYFWNVRNLHRPFWELRKIINHIPRCKVLHSTSTGYAGFLGALLQKRHNIPYILTEHGIYTKERWIEILRHYFFKNSSGKHTALTNVDPIQEIWTSFFAILAKIAYTKAYPIISLTEDYRKRQIKDGAILEKTAVISYGIDFNQYKFLNKSLNTVKPIIACIARVVPIKDIKTFIRAAAVIITKIPTIEAWIIGSITEDPIYLESCKNLIATLGFTENIKFLGTQNMHEIYSKIDLLILTSISEGSPFVMLESLAVGIPMVATDVGGCGELIYGKNNEDKELGEAGRLVPIADPKSTAYAAIELLEDKQTWKTCQTVGLERVRRYYSMQQLVNNYGKIYREAITDGRDRL